MAYWFYIDGVDTIIRMAMDLGMSIGFSSTDMILALLITQFVGVGFPSAIFFNKLGEKWGIAVICDSPQRNQACDYETISAK
jgi:UMF1 family MFS transporter